MMAGSDFVRGGLVDGSSYMQSVFGKFKTNFNVAHFNCGSINPATQQKKLVFFRKLGLRAKPEVVEVVIVQ